jgi:hypothetical protein
VEARKSRNYDVAARGDLEKSGALKSDNGNAYEADTERRYISQLTIVKRFLGWSEGSSRGAPRIIGSADLTKS